MGRKEFSICLSLISTLVYLSFLSLYRNIEKLKNGHSKVCYLFLLKYLTHYYYYYIYTRAKYWGTWYQGYEGTWYGKDEKDSVALKAQLDEWLKKAKENGSLPKE